MGPVGRLIWREERGRGSSELAYYGPLPLVSVTVCAPARMGAWRRARRMRQAVAILRQAGVRRVIWDTACPWRAREAGFAPVEVEELYQAQADRLVLAELERLGVAREEGRVALVGQRLTIPLQRTAQRLCPQVRGLLIQVPGQGEDYARWLYGQYGLPMAPAGAGADVTVAFSPGGPRWGRGLEVYGPCQLEGLRLAAPGLELPPDIEQPLLAQLWERGMVRGEDLVVTERKGEP